jgi:carboxypeptidase C (cathepsin A)
MTFHALVMWLQDSDDQVHDEPGVAADLLDFMQEFQKARPHLANREFYVTGESYGVSAVAWSTVQYSKYSM